jgi:hypothetical protein
MIFSRDVTRVAKESQKAQVEKDKNMVADNNVKGYVGRSLSAPAIVRSVYTRRIEETETEIARKNEGRVFVELEFEAFTEWSAARVPVRLRHSLQLEH